MTGAWLITLLAALSVEGAADCPNPTALAARLAKLETPPHRAQLLQKGERAIELTLFDERGERLAQRELVAATCQGLLEAAVATLAAWEASLPVPAPVVAHARTPLTVPAAPVIPSAELRPEPLTAWRLDLGLVGALSGSLATGGLAVAFLLGPRAALWRATVHVSGLLPVETPAASAWVSWMRPSAGMGLSLRVLEGPVQLEASAGLEAGLLVAWGRGFEQNFVSRAFDPAAELSLRTSRVLVGRLELFVQFALSLYFIQQTLQVTGVGVNVPLPAITGGLRLGLGFGG